jgi:beta-lactam-binding protein with PASTA domain
MADSMENRDGDVQNTAKRGSIGRVLLDALAETLLNVIVFFFRFVGWSVRWTFAVVFFLAVMVAAGIYVFNQAVVGGDYVEVPNIVNLPITEASYRLAQVGLDIGRQREMPSDQVPAYHVIAQHPEAGRLVRQGREVAPTVSRGPEFIDAPNLIGKAVEDVENVFGQGFRRGTTARIPHPSPRNQVIAQDPGPGMSLSHNGEIHLLVSDGPSLTTFAMPDLLGKSLEDVLLALGEFHSNAVANRVDRPEADYDVVLAQHPAPGTILHPGDPISYDIRSSGLVALPNTLRKVEVVYTVPASWFDREVRIDVIDGNNQRQTVLPSQADYESGVRPKFQPGSTIRLPLSFPDQLQVEIYVDGVKARTIYYAGDADPLITDHADLSEGEERA